MTLEISHGKSRYQYRIAPGVPNVIERRLNKRGTRWTFFLRRDTAKEAKAALLNIERQAQPQAQ